MSVFVAFGAEYTPSLFLSLSCSPFRSVILRAPLSALRYSTSETRLYDIMEDVCKSGNDCRAAMDEAEEIVEEWWKNRDEKAGLDKMCVGSWVACATMSQYRT